MKSNYEIEQILEKVREQHLFIDMILRISSDINAIDKKKPFNTESFRFGHLYFDAQVTIYMSVLNKNESEVKKMLTNLCIDVKEILSALRTRFLMQVKEERYVDFDGYEKWYTWSDALMVKMAEFDALKYVLDIK